MKHTMLRSLLCGGLILFTCSSVWASTTNQQQTSDTSHEKSLVEQLGKIQKKTDKLNLYLDMHGAMPFCFESGFQSGKFELRELRLEARGQLTPWLSYRYRQKLNRSNEGSMNRDNLPNSIDFACLNVQLSPRWGLSMGRQGAMYGGTEYDLNPIEVYEYADFTANTEAFMTGLSCSYQLNPTQEISFQVLNNRNEKSTEEMYGVVLEDAKLPLVYTLNWSGNFSDCFFPRWSVSYIQEPLSKEMYFMTLGNEFRIQRLGGYFDITLSKEGLDRTGLVHRLINSAGISESGYNLVSSRYLSAIFKLNYQLTPSWNVFAKGMLDQARLTSAVNQIAEQYATGKCQTSYGYLAGVEYFPLQDSNFRFFMTYVGRSYRYEDLLPSADLTRASLSDYDTHRLSLGFVYHLPLF